jgi:hypothetical protein
MAVSCDPEHLALHSPIESLHWRFERALRPSDTNPSGFADRASQVGVRFNGFYLFQITDSREEMAA